MFMETVDERFCSFVKQINEYLTGNGCKCDIKLQKSGYVVPYVLNSSQRTLATSICRKTGNELAAPLAYETNDIVLSYENRLSACRRIYPRLI